MLKKLKEIFSIKRIVYFVFISGLFLVFYAPHLSFQVDLDSVSEGTICLANYNTDRGEEIFENYNYDGHKTWVSVAPYYKDITVSDVPVVTNSLQMKVQEIQTMVINKITISFGPVVLKEYNADNFSQEIVGSQGLDITIEDNKITLELQNVEGWIQLPQEEYLSKVTLLEVYAFMFLVAWVLAVLIDKHVSLIQNIPLNELMLIA